MGAISLEGFVFQSTERFLNNFIGFFCLRFVFISNTIQREDFVQADAWHSSVTKQSPSLTIH